MRSGTAALPECCADRYDRQLRRSLAGVRGCAPDVALYVAILGEIGPVAHAVTTNVSINFLRRPAPADLIGKAKLMKLGKRPAIGEVALYSEGQADLVAHATGTYSIPARGEAAS
jgi:acyl-coenzyme A thioesterase PaaI-like protein